MNWPTRPLLLSLLLLGPDGGATGPFIVDPYLQLGADPALDRLSLLWHGPDQDLAWTVEISANGRTEWGSPIRPAWVRVAVPTVAAHRVYTAVLEPLAPGAAFRYRVLLDGREVFRAAARARKGPGTPQRVVVMGDLAAGGPWPAVLARQVLRRRPDLVVAPGDLVYQDGRIPEYRKDFFPVYNAGPGAQGAPLLRSTLVVAGLGNHDLGERGPRHPFAEEPDAMAYYLYWSQPLNGPALAAGGPFAPTLTPGRDWTWEAFLAAAGRRFPTMGSFSFDSGDVHWTVLDSNPYADWEREPLRGWLARDLAGARKAVWRFVVFHHPPFNLSRDRVYEDQWMARIWPVLERGGVDLTFSGHVHLYVRTRPLRFRPDPPGRDGLDPATRRGQVRGRLAVDPRFDGRVQTRADGIIPILTGAGGAYLHLKGRGHRFVPKPFVVRTVSQEHSFSLLEIRGRRLLFRQMSADGSELDRFVLTK